MHVSVSQSGTLQLLGPASPFGYIAVFYQETKQIKKVI